MRKRGHQTALLRSRSAYKGRLRADIINDISGLEMSSEESLVFQFPVSWVRRPSVCPELDRRTIRTTAPAGSSLNGSRMNLPSSVLSEICVWSTTAIVVWCAVACQLNATRCLYRFRCLLRTITGYNVGQHFFWPGKSV